MQDPTSSKQKVSKHKVVTITYSISHEDGVIAEQSDLPIEYIHGVDNDMFPKVEAALKAKSVGDSVEVTLSPQDGFGPHDPSLTFTDLLENVPQEFRFVGARPSFQNEQGEVVEMVVSKIEDGKLTVDANHPFAGKNMRFNVTVVGVRDATEEEINSRQIMNPASNTLQ